MKRLSARVPDSIISLGIEIRDKKDAQKVDNLDEKLNQAKVDLLRSLARIGISNPFFENASETDESVESDTATSPRRRLLVPTRFMWHSTTEKSKIATKVSPPELAPSQLMPVTLGNLAVKTVSVFRDKLIDPNDIERRDLRRYHRGDILTLPLIPTERGNYDLPDTPVHLFTAFPYFPLSVSEDARPKIGRFFSEI